MTFHIIYGRDGCCDCCDGIGKAYETEEEATKAATFLVNGNEGTYTVLQTLAYIKGVKNFSVEIERTTKP